MLFLTIELILNFWRIFGIFEIVIKYILTVKCISSYSFHSIVLKLYRTLLQDMSIMCCAFFDDRIIFEFLANFWNIGIIYSNREMYLFLQFSFNRYEIMQGFSIGCRRYGLFFFDDWSNFGFLANFGNFWNNDIIYSNCKMYILVQFSFNRFEINRARP